MKTLLAAEEPIPPTVTEKPARQELTEEQWQTLWSRLTSEERDALDGLRKQLWNAEQLLQAWVDPMSGVDEWSSGYERARAAVRTAEIEIDSFTERLRREYGI